MKESTDVAKNDDAADMRSEPGGDQTDTADELREAIIELSGAHSRAIIEHGTRMLVAGEMLISIASQLPGKTRAEIAGTFRKRIERLLALGDDRALPSAYMDELVREVNRYLQVLDHE
jgi:hypothetical protein